MKYAYFLILLFLAACNSSSPSTTDKPKVNYERIADAITHQTAKKIEKETGLHLIGTGGGMMNHIRMMGMSFNCFQEIPLERARELLIYCANEYLQAINANEEVRPYLIHYPFTLNDVQIRIFVRSPDRRDVPVGSLAVAALIREILDYDIKVEGNPSIETVHKETYAEAVAILEAQKSPLIQNL